MKQTPPESRLAHFVKCPTTD